MENLVNARSWSRINQVREACDSHKDFDCTVLDVSISADLEVPSGHIRVRLAPAGVEPLIRIAANGGRITSQNTHAEDLAEPIADTEREISSTQMQIDSLNTQRANLKRRVVPTS